MLQCYFCNLKKIFLRISPLLQSVAAVCAHQCSLFLDLRVANSYFFISIRMLAISAIFHGNCPTRARKVLLSICSPARRKPLKPAHNPIRNPTHSTRSTPDHPPRALAPHHRRRLRQLRRVDLKFLPPGRALLAPDPSKKLALKVEGVL